MSESAPFPGHTPVIRTAKNCGAPTPGTTLANYSYTPSWTLESALPPPRLGWGGARNRSDRPSLYLSRRQVEGLIAAACHAQKIGCAFNRHWTIHYERASIADCDGPRFIRRVLRLASKQARRDGGELAAAWVRESGEGKGAHVHILLHLPPGTTLRNRTRRWIVAAGGASRARVSKVRSIGGKLSFHNLAGGPILTNVKVGEHYQVNADAVLAYLLKGADAATGAALDLPRWGEAGPITGKRCGWTQNIGAASRSRAAT